MKIRECLKELAGKFNLPNEEYKELISYRELASNKKLMEKLLQEKSPEAIKVACLSGRVYGVALKDIQNLYMGEGEVSIEELMKKYSDAKDFEKYILSKVDINIINRLTSYFSALEQKKCELQNQQQDTNKEPSDIDEISANIAVIDKCIVPYKAHRKAIRQRKAREESGEGFKIRQENLWSIYQKTPGGILDDFINSSGVLSEEQKKLIVNTNFFKKVLKELYIYDRQGIAILWELWKQKLIKYENKDVLVYLQQHSQQVNDFLKERIQFDEVDIEDSFFGLLFQAMLGKEKENFVAGETDWDIDVWNEFVCEEYWQCILNKMLEIIPSDEISPMLSLVLKKLEGRAAKIFVEVLCESYIKENNISLWEIVNNMSHDDFGQNKEIILRFMQCIEKSNTVKGKKIAALERRFQGQAKEVFANIYEPEEKLEELVTNLATFTGEINPNIVRQQLLFIAKDFRKGFEELGVRVLAGDVKWESNQSVRFNSDMHAMPMNGRPKSGDYVKLRTLGFFYKDEDGNCIKHLAKVYCENKDKKETGHTKIGESKVWWPVEQGKTGKRTRKR